MLFQAKFAKFQDTNTSCSGGKVILSAITVFNLTITSPEYSGISIYITP
ncbi:MAG: hypothetical protein QNJ74_15545 [Trichodesmium sp. MO_231.B1]|nr:hypothetical protein [Trichodesmium sp. MO_231.B1]